MFKIHSFEQIACTSDISSKANIDSSTVENNCPSRAFYNNTFDSFIKINRVTNRADLLLY